MIVFTYFRAGSAMITAKQVQSEIASGISLL